MSRAAPFHSPRLSACRRERLGLASRRQRAPLAARHSGSYHPEAADSLVHVERDGSRGWVSGSSAADWVNEDSQHACLFRCARVDRFDAPICDRALNNYRAYGARTVNIGRVCGATADLKVTICAWDRLSDGAHARPPAICSARTATRWASSTLNPLC